MRISGAVPAVKLGANNAANINGVLAVDCHLLLMSDQTGKVKFMSVGLFSTRKQIFCNEGLKLLPLTAKIKRDASTRGESSVSRKIWFAAGFAVLVGCCNPANAGDTTYSYYPVSGDSAAEILNSMRRHQPVVGGMSAYATTASSFQPTWQTVTKAGKCQVSNYDVDIKFVMRLPKLASSSSVSGADRAAWQQFKTFVRAHEEHHRTIWLGCRSEHVAEVRQLGAAGCGELTAKLVKLQSRMRKSCDARHAAFDSKSRNPLRKQRFLKLAAGN
jgi:predicted secreted Zn-dependent protease